jgi:Uma2 family endonuclease
MEPMGSTTLLSFEEFERLPDEPGKDELLDGEWFHLPPAVIDHMDIVHRVFALLTSMAYRFDDRFGRVYMETGYKLGSRNWVVPDVSITRRDQPRGKYLEGAPALAVEVISESNTARQIERKRRLYIENGTVEVWIFYPDSESVWLYRAGHAEEFSSELRSEIIPGLRIDLRELFAAA